MHIHAPATPGYIITLNKLKKKTRSRRLEEKSISCSITRPHGKILNSTYVKWTPLVCNHSIPDVLKWIPQEVFKRVGFIFPSSTMASWLNLDQPTVEHLKFKKKEQKRTWKPRSFRGFFLAAASRAWNEAGDDDTPLWRICWLEWVCLLSYQLFCNHSTCL